MKTEQTYKKIWFIVITVLALVLDRVTKQLAVKELMNTEGIDVIGKIFRFVYVENEGAAFGMLQGKRIFFFIITAIVIVLIVYFLIKIPDETHYLPIGITVSFILAGAIGNLIDRIFYRYVVDFIYFTPIDFPVFNVADIYVTCGCVVFAILVLFVYKDRDFDFLAPVKKDAD